MSLRTWIVEAIHQQQPLRRPACRFRKLRAQVGVQGIEIGETGQRVVFPRDTVFVSASRLRTRYQLRIAP